MKKNDFLALAGTYMPDLKRYLLSYVADEALVEDLAHDCLLQAVDLYDHQRYDENKSLKNWLFCMAYSRLMDYMRKRETCRYKLYFHQDSIRMALGWESSDPYPAEHSEIDRFRSHYAQTLLRTRFENLPVTIAQRKVLQMRYLERLTYKQIAERLHEPLSTVLSRHTYAMRLLRGMYMSRRRHRRGGGVATADEAVC